MHKIKQALFLCLVFSISSVNGQSDRNPYIFLKNTFSIKLANGFNKKQFNTTLGNANFSYLKSASILDWIFNVNVEAGHQKNRFWQFGFNTSQYFTAEYLSIPSYPKLYGTFGWLWSAIVIVFFKMNSEIPYLLWKKRELRGVNSTQETGEVKIKGTSYAFQIGLKYKFVRKANKSILKNDL